MNEKTMNTNKPIFNEERLRSHMESFSSLTMNIDVLAN